MKKVYGSSAAMMAALAMASLGADLLPPTRTVRVPEATPLPPSDAERIARAEAKRARRRRKYALPTERDRLTEDDERFLGSLMHTRAIGGYLMGAEERALDIIEKLQTQLRAARNVGQRDLRRAEAAEEKLRAVAVIASEVHSHGLDNPKLERVAKALGAALGAKP